MSLGKIWNPRRILGVAMVLALALGWTAFRAASRYGMPLESQGNEIGGTYRLTALGNGSVTEGDFKGSWVLMWFFDTHCPRTVCGPTIKAMSDATSLLAKAHIAVSPLAVTLDPFRDQAEQLQDYVLPIGHEVMPMTAAPVVVERVAHEFHAPVDVIKAPDGTAYHRPAPQIVIMDPTGHYAGTVDATISGEDLAARLQALARKN